jgi:hypothetical protein
MVAAALPLAVERGKTSEVTVYAGGQGGTNLYGAYKVLFSGEGVKGEIVPPEKGWPAKDPKKPWDLPGVDNVKVRVTVAADAALGVREFRLATPRHGISTVGQLVIDDGPQTLKKDDNTDIAHAQPVTVPCNIDGRFQNAEQTDHYKFKASAGQEIVFTILCARVEDKIHDLQEHADPLLILCDATGKEITENDDYYRADSLLHYRFERDGDYILKVRDINYHGNPYWVYRLAITTRPWVTAVVPCAVRPGQSVDLHVSGYNLGATQAVHLDVPKETPPGLWSTPLKFPNGMSNSVPLLVVNAPQAVHEPPTAPQVGTAQPVTVKSAPIPLALPGGVSTWLSTPGQVDRYTFHAKKGQGWGFEITARRLDSEMDSEIKVLNAKGDVLAENDDTFGKDSRIDWSAPDDGDYTLAVRDLAAHAGPTYFYNLTAQPLRPDFALRCDPDRALIAPGNRTAWFVLLDRKYGFAGPVKVDIQGLPSGVSASALTIPPEMSQGVVILSAAPDAKIDMSFARVLGTADLPDASGKPMPATRVAAPQAEIYQPGGGRGQDKVETQGVGVTEPNDIEVSVAKPDVTLTPGGEAKIEVTIKRRADYTKQVTLDLRVNHLGGVFTDPLPPGVTLEDGVTIPENQNKGTITIKASGDAKPIKNWPLAVMANVSLNFVMKTWYVAPLSLTVTPPPAKK